MNDRDREAADDWMRDHLPSEEGPPVFHRESPSFPSNPSTSADPPGKSANSIPTGRNRRIQVLPEPPGRLPDVGAGVAEPYRPLPRPDHRIERD